MFGNFEKDEDAWRHYFEMKDKIGKEGVNPMVERTSFVAHPSEDSPQRGPTVTASSNFVGNSVDLWRSFFSGPGVTAVSQAQTIIHEMVHVISGAGDLFLAEKITGGQWTVPSGKSATDPAVVLEASGVWNAKLIDNCK